MPHNRMFDLRKLEHSFEARGFMQWRKSVECMKTDELASQLSGHKGDVAREFFKRLQQGAIANYFSIWTAHHVRVQARFFFIDAWDRASAWMMLDRTTAWTQQANSRLACLARRGTRPLMRAPPRA